MYDMTFIQHLMYLCKYKTKWSLTVRVRRFAQFVEGDSHVTDDELFRYESDHHTTLPKYDTDEESEISFSLNSQWTSPDKPSAFSDIS